MRTELLLILSSRLTCVSPISTVKLRRCFRVQLLSFLIKDFPETVFSSPETRQIRLRKALLFSFHLSSAITIAYQDMHDIFRCF